uniref:Uncharacterized protein n=1 Tax=Myoviridae sp. ctPSW2 TaxID=2826648 RepID=A0A8S5MNR9_9CAUD|nr:MAG TPA: hypothetical protein [Myoviridae sp. ctPSW2]
MQTVNRTTRPRGRSLKNRRAGRISHCRRRGQLLRRRA